MNTDRSKDAATSGTELNVSTTLGVIGKSVNHSVAPAPAASTPAAAPETQFRVKYSSARGTKTFDRCEAQFREACEDFRAPEALPAPLTDTSNWQLATSGLWAWLRLQTAEHALAAEIMDLIPASEAVSGPEGSSQVRLCAVQVGCNSEPLGSHLWAKIMSVGEPCHAGLCLRSCCELRHVASCSEERVWHAIAHRLMPKLRTADTTAVKQPTKIASNHKEACEWYVSAVKMNKWNARMQDCAMCVLHDVMPLLECAMKKVDNLMMKDCVEARHMRKPPACFVISGRLHRLMMGEDAATCSSSDYEYLQRALQNNDRWVEELRYYDKDNIAPQVLEGVVATVATARLDADKLCDRITQLPKLFVRWCGCCSSTVSLLGVLNRSGVF